MLRKVAVPVRLFLFCANFNLNTRTQITGLLLNQSHFICPSCTTSHQLFGSPAGFRATADRLGIEILAELPLVPGVSATSDQGIPYALVMGDTRKEDGVGGKLWNEAMAGVAENVWNSLRWEHYDNLRRSVWAFEGITISLIQNSTINKAKPTDSPSLHTISQYIWWVTGDQ